jgi:hypothetical protein
MALSAGHAVPGSYATEAVAMRTSSAVRAWTASPKRLSLHSLHGAAVEPVVFWLHRESAGRG